MIYIHGGPSIFVSPNLPPLLFSRKIPGMYISQALSSKCLFGENIAIRSYNTPWRRGGCPVQLVCVAAVYSLQPASMTANNCSVQPASKAYHVALRCSHQLSEVIAPTGVVYLYLSAH